MTTAETVRHVCGETDSRAMSSAAPEPVASTSSQREALQSTSIIGGSAIAVLLIRMVRTKILALFVGPAGIGLEALFDSVVALARSLFDLGINSSGVRQIAAAAATHDTERVAATWFTVRRICLVLGLTMTAALFLAREPVARLAFGHGEHASAIGWLSLMVLVGAVAAGQTALVQGMRRIRDLAAMNILGALAGAALSIPIVAVWGVAGIPAYMLLAAAAALVVSTWYAHQVPIAPVRVGSPEFRRETASLLKLGLAFMSSGLISTGALFVLRAMIARRIGVDGAGQFQAATALSMVYVGFVLQAMGTDYYPRLTAVARHDDRCNRAVNEQAEISLLLAAPGILGTLTLSPFIVQVFYSGHFASAAEVLAWQVTGMLLRVVSWPMGFVILAKGRGATLVWTDLAAYGLYLLLAWMGLEHFGLPGVGMAFVGLYVFHASLIYVVVRRLTGFRWTAGNIRLIALVVSSALTVLPVRLVLPEPWATLAGSTVTLLLGIHCFRRLLRLLGPAAWQRFTGLLPVSGVIQRARLRWKILSSTGH